MPKQKDTQQIWIPLVKYSSAEVWDPSEVSRLVGKLMFLVSSGSQADSRMLNIIVLALTSDNLVIGQFFSKVVFNDLRS